MSPDHPPATSIKQPASSPVLILGSALWGWTIPRDRAFALLDRFYEAGFRQIDAATNYPIDKDPEDWRKSEQMLQEWVETHRISDLEIIMKVGSLNNMRSPEHNLSKSFLLLNLDAYIARFGSNLHTFMIHWDNRDQKAAIRDTFEAFAEVVNRDLQPGLSGIRHPYLYAELNEQFQLDFQIEIKHNLLHSDYPHYASFHGKKRFLTYGINAGGIKLDPEAYRPDSSLRARGGNIGKPPPILLPLKEKIAVANQIQERPPIHAFHQCGMTFAWYSPGVAGILLGCSTLQQLEDSIEFYRHLQTYDYSDFFENLRDLHRTYASPERSI